MRGRIAPFHCFHRYNALMVLLLYYCHTALRGEDCLFCSPFPREAIISVICSFMSWSWLRFCVLPRKFLAVGGVWTVLIITATSLLPSYTPLVCTVTPQPHSLHCEPYYGRLALIGGRGVSSAHHWRVRVTLRLRGEVRIPGECGGCK